MDEKIGAKVRQMRKQATLSVKDAADICGLELGQYMDGEAGVRRFASMELFKLSNELEFSMSAFFDDDR